MIDNIKKIKIIFNNFKISNITDNMRKKYYNYKKHQKLKHLKNKIEIEKQKLSERENIIDVIA